MASLLNRPPGSVVVGARGDTAYCSGCKKTTPTKLIRGYLGVRDYLRCEECGRMWPS